MLRKRIIFSLIYSNGFFNQSRNFQLQKVGDIKWLENFYKFQKISFSIDELLIVNANKDKKDINEFSKNVSKIVNDVFVPISAGGGIKSISDAELLFKNGADKIILNTVLIENKELITDLVKKYGSQSIVASLDYKIINNKIIFFNNDGTNEIHYSCNDYIRYVQSLNVGEILLNSIDKDGTGFGYDFESIKSISQIVKIPLIIMGGAGNQQHLYEGLNSFDVDAVATANLFNFIGDGLPKARKWLLENGVNISRWE
jgi:imidazole glycerol-phosphate synthase subunit HisF